MCDIAYVLWWGRVEREHLALWQAAIIAGAMGSTVEVPSLSEAKERFDAALGELPSLVESGRAATLRVLGAA